MKRVQVVLCLTVVLGAIGSRAEQEHAGQYAQADIQYGAAVYAAQCTSCHGPNGDQVGGVDLRSGAFRNARSDDDLRRLITVGIPGTSMAGRKLDNAELVGVIAYIRNMRDFASKPVTLGEGARGQTLIEGKGRCLTCHRVNGRGSLVAPDLSEIGASRSAGALHQALVDPSSVMMPINRPFRAVTKDGKVVRGRRLNEDTFTIQLIDDQERLVSLMKADLREFTVEAVSAMPSYKDQLTDGELADVIAYLVTLKGR